MSTANVTLRLLDKADKEILRLPRTVKDAIYDFQHRFKANPGSSGLRLKPLTGHTRLWSARISDDYRALLLRLADDDWLIVSVKHRRDVYGNLDRLAYGVNQVTGGLEYVDLQVVEESVVKRLLPPPAPSPLPEQPAEPAAPTPLFAHVHDE
jgi:mRNA-degrading endonuclease RelE of RelBE toxin-antitoxin system